jgi:hypothetical protein
MAASLKVSTEQYAVLKAILTPEQLAKVVEDDDDDAGKELASTTSNSRDPLDESAQLSEMNSVSILPSQAVVATVDSSVASSSHALALPRPTGLVPESSKLVPEITAKKALLRYYANVYGHGDDKDWVCSVNNAALLRSQVLPENSWVENPLAFVIRGLDESVSKEKVQSLLASVDVTEYVDLNVSTMKHHSKYSSNLKSKLAVVTFANQEARQAAQAAVSRATTRLADLTRPGWKIEVKSQLRRKGKRIRCMLSTSAIADLKDKRPKHEENASILE